jgi:hypothetical protein
VEFQTDVFRELDFPYPKHTIGTNYSSRALPLVVMIKILVVFFSLMILLSPVGSAQSGNQEVAAPADVKPGSITCEECPYPYPSSYLALTLYGQDVRMAYMDVAPQGQPNGHTVVLLHGNNFAGFYFGVVIDALREEGFRVIVPTRSATDAPRNPSSPTTSPTWRGTRARSCRA